MIEISDSYENAAMQILVNALEVKHLSGLFGRGDLTPRCSRGLGERLDEITVPSASLPVREIEGVLHSCA